MGGAGPESTILLYRLITTSFQNAGAVFHNDFPYMMILNVPIPNNIDKIHQKDKMVELIIEASVTLGHYVDFIALPCNTLHMQYDTIVKYSKVPVIHMINEVKNEIITKKYKKPLILGTQPLLESKIYFSDRYDMIKPSKNEQKVINKIITHVVAGKFIEKDKKYIKQQINYHNADIVVLGCTELPILNLNIPYISSIHVLANKIMALVNDGNG